MHIDLMKMEGNELLHCDVCIAGAGAAGLTIANALAGTKLNVILLESGGFQNDPDTSKLYEGKASGNIAHNDEYLRWSRLRYFGGSTNHWAGLCRPLDAIDFEKRNWIEKSGWPVNREDLEPYYRKAEETVEIGSFKNLDAEQFQLDYINFREAGIRAPWYQYSQPVNFGKKFRDPVVQAENIQLILNANLSNIRLSTDKRAVTEVHCRSLNGKKISIVPGKFILACGGIENARILLACRDDIPEGIGNYHGLVGKYFIEHPHIGNSGMMLSGSLFSGIETAFLKKNKSIKQGRGVASEFWNDFERQSIGPVEAKRVFAVSPEMQRHEKLLNLSAEIISGRKLTDHADDYFPHSLAQISGKLSFAGEADNDPETLYSKIYVRAEQAPSVSNHVKLTREKDALGIPRTELKCSISTAEKEMYRRSLHVLGRGLGIKQLARMRIDIKEDTPATGGAHHMGTTRMSDNPKEGVTDTLGCIHGMENFYIAGSSVFPTGGFANPTLTLVALAHRLADHILSEKK
jgi:choline dehydrogenase-like flavoprotein